MADHLPRLSGTRWLLLTLGFIGGAVGATALATLTDPPLWQAVVFGLACACIGTGTALWIKRR